MARELERSVEPGQDTETPVGEFKDFISKANPAFQWYPHNYTLAEVAQKIADGSLKRVMIWVPPGTGKSETISRLLAAYYLSRYPNRTVGLVSYGASLAEDISGEARDYFEEAGGILDPSTEAKNYWKVRGGGGMWAAGFAGAIRGKRFHLGIVDDPHKGPEDLESETLKEKFHKWWKRTWLNRQNIFFKDGAAIVVVMQRLDENDLCGWLLKQKDPAAWTIVALDAVKQETPIEVPESCTLYPDNREVGENLCPELLTEEYLLEQQADLDTYAAQFLQRPRKIAGAMLDRLWFRLISERDVPPLHIKVLGVDLAVKATETNDYTVAFPVGVSFNGNYYVFPPLRAKMESPDANVAIAEIGKRRRVRKMAIESVAFQESVIQHLKRNASLAGIVIEGVHPLNDKSTRVRTWSPLAKQGLIYLVDDGSGWVEEFLQEAENFPRWKHDDQLDALFYAIEAIREMSGSQRPPGVVGGKSPGPLSMR